MYERHHERLLPFGGFLRRLALHAGVSLAVVLFSLWIGMLGYRHYEHMRWVDAFLNASMLLGGMGPVDPPKEPGGKVFAGLYALYSGLIFLVVVGIALSPVVHRVLHTFHLDDEAESGGEAPPSPPAAGTAPIRSGSR